MIPLIVAACFSAGPLADLAPARPPQVIRWPGGSLTLDNPGGPEVVIRRPGTDGRSTNVITGSGNGFGNRIVVSNGGAGGTTIIRNSRNGWGNRIVVDPEDEVIELPARAPAAARPPVRYPEDGKFWTQKVWSDAVGANVYWSPADRAWYRFRADDDSYHPVTGRP